MRLEVVTVHGRVGIKNGAKGVVLAACTIGGDGMVNARTGRLLGVTERASVSLIGCTVAGSSADGCR